MFQFHLHLNLFIIIVNLLFSASAEIPQTVLCADPKCSEAISEAQASLTNVPGEKHVLGFRKGMKIIIFCKSEGKNKYWGGKIGSRIGFVPPHHIKEVSVWKSMDMLKYKVPSSNILALFESKENDNLNQKSSAVNTNKGSEKLISGTAQDIAVNSQSNEIFVDADKSLSELSNEKQSPQLNNTPTATPSAAKNSVSNSPLLDPVTGMPNNLLKKDFDAEKQLEIGEKISEKYVNQIISNENNGEKEVDNLNIESGGSEMKNLSVVSKSEGMSAEQINQEQTKLSEKVNTEPELRTGELSESNNVDPNEKSEAENQYPKPNVEKIVKLKENENYDDSNNFNISTSDNNISDNNEFKKHDMNKHVSDNIKKDIVNETQFDSTEVPVIIEDIDPSFIPGESSSMESENETSIKLKNSGDVSQNDLPNRDERINVGTEFKTDPGTVNEINVASSNIDANVGVNDSVAYNNATDASAVISSDSSNSISSDDGSPPAGNSDEGTSMSVNDFLMQSTLPPHQYQKGINTVPNLREGVNAEGGKFGDEPEEKITQNNDFNSVHKPYPSSAHASPGQVPPYNFVRQRKKCDTEATPLGNIEGPQSAGLPPPIASNSENNQMLYQQFAAPASESLHVKESDYEDNQEAVKRNEETSSEKQYGVVNEPDSVDEKRASTQKNIEMENVEKPSAGSSEMPEMENAQHEDGEHFQDEIPVHSPAEKITDINFTEDPSENTNFEVSTPGPSVHGYQNTEEGNVQDEDAGQVPSEMKNDKEFFSKLGETLLEMVGLGSKKQEPETKVQEGNHFEEIVFVKPQSSEFNHPQKQVAAPEESCQAADGTTEDCSDVTSGDSNPIWNFWLDNGSFTSPSSYNTFIYLVVTAVTVLFFTLGYYFIEKFRSDRPLIAKVNKLEQELLVSSKECLILKDELSNTKEKLNLFETSSNDKIISSLQLELEEAKKIRAELENNVEVLQQELDAATEAGLDLNRMLSEVLTQKGGSETLMESVEHLQAQLNNQQKIIDEMTSKLFAKTNENQELQDELTAANEKIENLESEIEDLRGNLNVHLKENEDIIKDLTTKNNELQMKLHQVNEVKEKETGKLKKNLAEFEKKLKATSVTLEIKEEECNNLKDSVKKIKVRDGKNIDSLFETSRIKAELSQATSENTSLKDQLRAEEDKVIKLDVKVKKLEEEVEKLKHMSSEAEKEKAEAQTRLEVLSNYFKEKETQLQKELGLREAMWVQKQGDDSTIYEKMKSLEDEINSFKSQNEALKKEILDQERGLKVQITNLEKKAHENWIAARQAERKLEETKQEAAQLRNKMTLMEKNISNDLESSQHHRVSDELNGGDALSPLIHDTSSPILFPPPLPIDPNNSSLMPPGFIPPPMFMPPPPGGFMPPPPPFLPGDHRPPPLGRMSSPPLNNRFSPPPPDYAYSPPLSPSNRNYRSPNEADRGRKRFRHETTTSPPFHSRNWEGPSTRISMFRPITRERDSRREQKGESNLSSGHSSDSLDKSSRHSSRV